MIKECKIHGLTEFSNSDRRRCRKCQVIAVQKRREVIKKMAIEYKGGECIHCGYKKCVDALEFHHLDPSKKEFSLSDKGHCRSWEIVKKELDKCILLCSNCHKEIHSKKVQLA